MGHMRHAWHTRHAGHMGHMIHIGHMGNVNGFNTRLFHFKQNVELKPALETLFGVGLTETKSWISDFLIVSLLGARGLKI